MANEGRVTNRTIAVVVNYNTSDRVRLLIESLKGEPLDKIVVVDNSSELGDRQLARTLLDLDNRVEIVQSPENGGFGAGVNLGVRCANPRRSDIVMVLNPDLIVRSGFVSEIIDCVFGSERPRLVCPLILDDDEKIWFAGGALRRRLVRVVHLLAGRALSDVHLQPGPTGFLTGAALGTLYSTWEDLNGFREDMFMYWEDVDLSQRALASGIELWFCPTAVAVHDEGGASRSTADRGRSNLYYYYVNRNRYLLRAGCRFRVMTALLCGFPQTVGMLVTPLLHEDGARLVKFREALRGQIDGVRGQDGIRVPRH